MKASSLVSDAKAEHPWSSAAQLGGSCMVSLNWQLANNPFAFHHLQPSLSLAVCCQLVQARPADLGQ